MTANTSTLYAWSFLDLEEDGPTVVEIPPGVLGVLNDAWFRYVGDMGAAGPDKGKGGKFLVLPPGYDGDVPDGYYVFKSRTYVLWSMMRGHVENNDPHGSAEAMKRRIKVYPLSESDNPPETVFVDSTGKAYNTISPNDFGFYEDLNQVIQKEPIDAIDPETRGLIASIGIVKGKPFAPDARMKKLLTEAVAIGNATARAFTFSPREPGARIYKGTDSSWMMAFVDKDVFFEVDGARNLDARTMFFYNYTVVTPAMAVAVPGAGSDYGIVFRDSDQHPFDGAKSYKLHLPAERAGQQLLGGDDLRHPDAFHASDGPELPDSGEPERGLRGECRRLLRRVLRTTGTRGEREELARDDSREELVRDSSDVWAAPTVD